MSPGNKRLVRPYDSVTIHKYWPINKSCESNLLCIQCNTPIVPTFAGVQRLSPTRRKVGAQWNHSTVYVYNYFIIDNHKWIEREREKKGLAKWELLQLNMQDNGFSYYEWTKVSTYAIRRNGNQLLHRQTENFSSFFL